MMSIKLNSPFYGLPSHCTVRRNNDVSFTFLGRRKWKNFFCSCTCGNRHQWTSQALGSSFFCGKRLQLPKPRLRIVSNVKCAKEPFFRTNFMMKSLSPLREEGLLLFRCSVVVAVISGVCFLVLFGRVKAKSFIESKVLPSICSALSEQIHREIDFGKVHIVSPLSITLESCAIGPHNEEFSCAQVPTIKICVCLFSSLRKGKLVINASLSHPIILVVQKKDYTWLGIPISDGIFRKHLSTDEGIDYRTKKRRRAREDAFDRWDKDRDDAAREAAGMNYMIHEETTCSSSDFDVLKEGPSFIAGMRNSGSFVCLTEGVSGVDHRCLDTGAQYDLKHADLEKSFNIKIPGSGLNFWSNITQQHPTKHKVKRRANGNDLFVAHNATVKRRILERSALMANLHFSNGIIGSSFGDRSTCKKHILDSHVDVSDTQTRHSTWSSAFIKLKSCDGLRHFVTLWTLILNSGLFSYFMAVGKLFSLLSGPMQELKPHMVQNMENTISEPADELEKFPEDIGRTIPVILDSVNFKGGTLMLLAYGDKNPREMEISSGHIKFQNHYNRVNVQVTGFCNLCKFNVSSGDGGWLSTDVFIDIVEQRWHVNLRVANLSVPLFERILQIPILWSKGRATGEVHICMSKEESFPNLNGQLDVTGLAFQIHDAPSSFFDVSAILCFRGQRIFLQNASGLFGNVPLEASGDFGIHPDEGEFHLMCQVPCVEINTLMRSFKMKPLMFSLAGSITAVFNCQGPLFAPIFVGSGMVTRKILHSVPDASPSSASEAVMKNRDAGAVAALDRVPFSYLSTNFTFNTDNCVSDLYGIRATLVDGGEIRGAGNVWICPEGEADEEALDMNFSGNLSFLEVLNRYFPGNQNIVPLKLGNLIGETKLSGTLLRPKLDINWTAPKAEGSFSDARGDIIISHDCIVVNSSSIAFDLYLKVLTSYLDGHFLERKGFDSEHAMPIVIEGVEMDLRMFNFEFFSLESSYPFDFPRPLHMKSSGRVKFQGKVTNNFYNINNQSGTSEMDVRDENMASQENTHNLAGEVSISALKVNQLMVAPHLIGQLIISNTCIKLDATGRLDERLAVEVIWPLEPSGVDLRSGQLLSFSLQRGQLRVNVCYRPLHLANLEVRNLPLDELELASLRGTIQRAEFLLNLQKRKGHGVISVLQPKFSGVLGEALDVATKWSGDVITVEKGVLEQSKSRYEVQGEYVLPGSRSIMKGGGVIERALGGHLSSVISSMGRWRMRFEVPRAQVTELLPLARLLSHSADPDVRSRSKDLFIQCLQSVGLHAERIQDLLEVIRKHPIESDEVILDDVRLPGLSELRGAWHGSLDASGGGNGDTVAEFDFHGEDWEWGCYKTQRVLAIGAYNIDDGLRLEKLFIQKDNATIHADGTLLGPKANLHFAVLNFPIGIVPTLVQILESSSSLHQLLAPIKGILYMEGDLRGSFSKPECDVQIRLLDGVIGGIELGRAEIFASLTSISRFLFNAKLEPTIQNGHVHIQGSVPVTFIHNNTLDEEDAENNLMWIPGWAKEKSRGPSEEKKVRDNIEEGWDTELTESLKGLNWNILDAGEVRVDADIKDGGMMLLTALSPYADWLHGHAEIMLQVRGTVENPVVNGTASFHKASLSSPILCKPLINFGGTIHVDANRLNINSLESRVGRRGKLSVKGNLPLRNSEKFCADKIDLKCEVLDFRANNVLSGQIDSQIQIAGSILQPNISGSIKLSHGEAYLPHDRSNAVAPFNKLASDQSKLPSDDYKCFVTSRYVSRFFSAEPVAKYTKPSGKQGARDKESEQGNNNKPKLDFRLSDLRLVLGPELKIVYPLILNFAVSGELELNGVAHPKWIKPKGILTFENGDVNLVGTQVRLKREHLNIAKFEPDNGLDPLLDLALVGSEWQFRIQSKASNWQDKLVVTSTRSVEQDVLSPTEAARVFESQLAESLLESDGQLALKKLAAATLERLMPRIEGKGEFGQARWSVVYAPQIPSLLTVDPSLDPLRTLANISFGAEVEVGKRLQASIVRQMKDSEMAMQWTLIYQLTSRLRVLLQSAPSNRLLFEYSATSQD